MTSRSNSSEQIYDLNTDEAIYIENNDGTHHSYTFSIETEDGSFNIENIVLSSREDGSYKAYDFVSGLANHIRDLITNNPTLNSGQIADLISFP